MKLDDSKVLERLARLKGWELVNGKLHKGYKFPTFEEAIAFINRVATVASSLDHHPEIFNVYNTVTLDINTHSEGGITELDFAFASKVDELGA
ncbi:MAG: 4a-hydroxytetrahydrobiopterin dehydratase [Candidatus Micrarchaeota archaeon]|nr:4a-hydroxytetrahydrobiopterin dehydratase [Candidatus Micrarchaeota archaeon]MDE1848126.1 4a-hydroxytetrahydrobiopterin dehydratase [Candidatus Micrarchaeota archaeon]MDE1863933.1 4a-hydroxytetrahydrobiopterin dehydratase [Candidatus Micrarchaeota archaeon]